MDSLKILYTILNILVNFPIYVIFILLFILYSKTRNTISLVLIIILYMLSAPVFFKIAAYYLENRTSLSLKELENKNIDAIIVLGGGLSSKSRLYKIDASSLTIERLRTAAFLYKILPKKPILILCGGKVFLPYSEASIMKHLLEQEFCLNKTTILLEEKSRTTKENILFLNSLLKKYNIKSAVLVTSSWHLKRAICIFKSYYPQIKIWGFANNYIVGNNFKISLKDFIPRLSIIGESSRLIKEYLKLTYDCLLSL